MSQILQRAIRTCGLAMALSLSAGAVFAGSTNGRAGTMPVYYDDQLFTMNFKQLSDQAAQSAIASNQSINVIYQSDDCMPGGSMFVSVIDAIQADGFNPLWQEVQII